MSYREIGALNGIRALYDPLERCSFLFLSQYLCLSFPIDENHTSKGRRGHSHEMTNGYWGRPCGVWSLQEISTQQLKIYRQSIIRGQSSHRYNVCSDIGENVGI